jgi:hypothetical protein
VPAAKCRATGTCGTSALLPSNCLAASSSDGLTASPDCLLPIAYCLLSIVYIPCLLQIGP